MSNDAIFLVSDSGELQRVEHELYASEDILQQLVAKHPDVLAGDQIDPEAPPRWLLLRREAAIPDREEGEDRWALDHLLLDQFCIPTLVEVKRSTDTRIRREVIGQMLDYVANAQAYWAAGRMRQMFADEGGSPEAADARLVDYLGISDEPEAVSKQVADFWNKVEANMRDGNVRLLFVADELPRELKKLIEFLNEQFTKIEVLGVELRQYVGQGIKALVPRVVGQTEAAREQKERSSPRARVAPSALPTNREAFLAACPADAAPFFAKVLDEAKLRNLQVSFGSKGFSVFAPKCRTFFWCYPPGANDRKSPELELFLKDVGSDTLLAEMRQTLQAIPSARPSGRFTIYFKVASDTVRDANQVFDLSLGFMKRQADSAQNGLPS